MIINKTERWKDIPGYKNLYKISSFGNVKRVKSKVLSGFGSFRIVKERILKPYGNQKIYPCVALSKKRH